MARAVPSIKNGTAGVTAGRCVAQVLDMKTHVSSEEADFTGARLNRARSEAVKEIQQKLVRDADLRRIVSR